MTDPDGEPVSLDYSRGYRDAVDHVATWLEECVSSVPLWARCFLAVRLRYGFWKAETRLKGLRQRDLLEGRHDALRRVGVPVEETPREIVDWAHSEVARRAAERAARDAKVAKILRDQYGMDLPSEQVKGGR